MKVNSRTILNGNDCERSIQQRERYLVRVVGIIMA